MGKDWSERNESLSSGVAELIGHYCLLPFNISLIRIKLMKKLTGSITMVEGIGRTMQKRNQNVT